MNRGLYISDRDHTRQKAMEAFVNAAQALCGYDPEGLPAALLWGALGVLRVASLCNDAMVEKAIGVVRASQEGRDA